MIPSIRVPSPGQKFFIKDIDSEFEIIKSKGRIITAKGKLKDNQIKLINVKDFSLCGTIFKINGLRMSDGKMVFSAIAVKGDKRD